MRNFQLPGRSPVMATNGMVSTSHPLATGAALNILRDGGNAVDAAIAASAILAVVEPAMTGIGGDCFVILCEPDGRIHGLNGSGRAAKGANLDWYLERNITDFNDVPAHSITVPGALKAWDTLLAKFGTRDFKSLFADAIDYGKNGFPVAPRVASDWNGLASKIKKNQGATHHLLRDGKAPQAGDIYKMPALAATLEAVANHGIDAFYRGEIAAEIAATVQGEGGFLSEEDLANVSADWVTPISTRYHGYDVHEIPPNGQGITALIMLNLLKRLNASNLAANSAERAHLEMEVGRIAYSVRDAFISDPANMNARVEQILSDQYSDELGKMFNSHQRNNDIVLPELPSSDTTYLTIIDRDLRAVSFINSLYQGFGSGIATMKSGIWLQNRGACFSLQPGHDNAIGPSKRPMHTIIPGMVTKNGGLAWSFGVMGGAYQPMGHAHVLANMIDYGMDPQEALDHGRIFWGDDGVLEIEDGVDGAVSLDLAARDHQVRPAPSPIGGGQIIGIDHASGVMVAGSDPRKDGMAAGF